MFIFCTPKVVNSDTGTSQYILWYAIRSSKHAGKQDITNTCCHDPGGRPSICITPYSTLYALHPIIWKLEPYDAKASLGNDRKTAQCCEPLGEALGNGKMLSKKERS